MSLIEIWLHLRDKCPRQTTNLTCHKVSLYKLYLYKFIKEVRNTGLCYVPSMY